MEIKDWALGMLLRNIDENSELCNERTTKIISTTIKMLKV